MLWHAMLAQRAHSSGQEEQCRCSLCDSLDVVLVVPGQVVTQQVADDPHDGHEEQEGEDALAKQEAWCAVGTRGHETQSRRKWEKCKLSMQEAQQHFPE